MPILHNALINLAFSIIKRLIRRKFPTVQGLTTKEFAQWLADAQQILIVLDARTEAEYTTSHLLQAQRIDPQHPDVTSLVQVSSPIVVYCSVGYRSARVAECLQQAGCDRVYNLEGSIFQWVNEGRPVFQDNCPTQVVHPYNQLWGKLLKSRYRAATSQLLEK